MTEDAGRDRERTTERLQQAITRLEEAGAAAAVSVQIWAAHYPEREADSSDMQLHG